MRIPDLPEDSANLDAALAYAEAGWYLLPVKQSVQHRKNPGSVVGEGWQHQSSRDPKQIAAWFAATDYGIALHVGRSGAVVIDLDNPDEMPDELLHPIINGTGPFQSSRDDASGRGHYPFVMPPGRTIGNSEGSATGLGFNVRGLNGVIIVQPSIHKEAANGGRYKWETTGVLPVLPSVIADKLPDVSAAEDTATDEQVRAFIASCTASNRPSIIHGFRTAWERKVANGSRHNATVSILAGTAKEAHAGYYTAQAVLDMFRPKFIEAMAKPGAISNTIEDAATAGRHFDNIFSWAVGQALGASLDEVHARVQKEIPVAGDSVSEFLGGPPPTPDEPVTVGHEPPSPWLTVDGATFILDQPQNVPAIWGRGDDVLWPDGEGLMIAGGQGLGKTTLAGCLVRGLLGLDDEVLGYPVNGGGEIILYLAMDRPRQIARSLGRQFTAAERAMLKARLIVRPGPPHADIAKNPELLQRMASELGARYVFVDSVKDAAVGLSDDEVGASYNRARQHLLHDGRQICDLHHVIKRSEGSIADIYGSTWLTSGCGSVITLTGNPGDPVVGFRHAKPAVNEVGPFRLSHDSRAGRMNIVSKADLVALAGSSADGVTKREAAMVMNDTDEPTPNDIAQAGRDLDKLVSRGVLQRVDGTTGGRGGGTPARWYPA
jgi:hypothetical protein